MMIRRHRRRAGFSLLEIMVVLAVFVMIASLSVPLLLRSFAGQSLKTSGDVIRARLAEARVRAIDTGDVYAFYYAPGGGDYFVAPMVLGFRSQLLGLPLNIQRDSLPDKIVFAAGETAQDARSQQQSEQAVLDMPSMRPVLFYPDGTSQNATLILQNKTGALLEVRLRGLTGTATASNILSPEQVQQ